MKQTIYILLLAVTFFTACSDLLDTESTRILPTDKHTLQSLNDESYSLIGIAQQVNQLLDRYVLLGELRGELMTVTENADRDLRAIAAFDYSASPDNPYLTRREYYTVINNCNYYITHVNDSLIRNGERPLLSELAVVKAYRAWVYMQLALNYGEAVYLEEPLLTVPEVEEAEKLPSIQRDELFNKLINDLEPYLYVNLELEDLPTYPAWYAYFSIPVLIGDMSLWMGKPTAALRMYFEAINRLTIVAPFSGEVERWNTLRTSTSSTSTGISIQTDWSNQFENFSSSRVISAMHPAENSVLQEMTGYPLTTVSAYTYKVAPSQTAIDLWKNIDYVYAEDATKPISYITGDLRGENEFVKGRSSTGSEQGSYGVYNDGGEAYPYITKYDGDYVMLMRKNILYLRYAEALNALGKPTLAFAVLKYGLKAEVINDPKKVDPAELEGFAPGIYFDFSDTRYDNSIGIHAMGAGYIERDTVYYILPDLTEVPEELRTAVLQEFVEEKIIEEYALETAFEGCRFHDLMRFATRRNDPSFLAKRVAKRDPALEAKLMDMNNWYLPAR